MQWLLIWSSLRISQLHFRRRLDDAPALTTSVWWPASPRRPRTPAPAGRPLRLGLPRPVSQLGLGRPAPPGRSARRSGLRLLRHGRRLHHHQLRHLVRRLVFHGHPSLGWSAHQPGHQRLFGPRRPVPPPAPGVRVCLASACRHSSVSHPSSTSTL